MKDSPWSTSQIQAPVIYLSLYETLFVFLKPPFLFRIFYALSHFPPPPFQLLADFLCFISCRQNLTMSAVFLQKYFFFITLHLRSVVPEFNNTNFVAKPASLERTQHFIDSLAIETTARSYPPVTKKPLIYNRLCKLSLVK